MSLVDALSRFRDPLEERAIRDNDLWGAWARGDDVGAATANPAGVNVSRSSALGMSAVWACVSLIADTIATLPITTYTRDSDGSKKPYRRPDWLDAPNPEQTTVDFVFNQVSSLLLDGSAFVYTLRDPKRGGDVAEAWVLDPNWVQVRREPHPGTGKLELVYYVQVAAGMQSPVGPFRIAAGPEMFHIVAFNSNSGYPRGLPPLEVARLMFGSGIANAEMGARFYGSGMNAGGVIETDEDLTDVQAKQLKEDFSRANGGLRKMHLPPVLTGGATWKQISISPEQAQFLQHREFTVTDVARFFGVPPFMVGDVAKSTSWGSGLAQQNTGFVAYTLRRWIERLEASWKRWMFLLDPPEAFVQFDVNGLLRGDPTTMADYFQKRFMTASATPNQIRAAFDEPPTDDGDIYYFPVNMAPVGTEPVRPNRIPVDENFPGGTDVPEAAPAIVRPDPGTSDG